MSRRPVCELERQNVLAWMPREGREIQRDREREIEMGEVEERKIQKERTTARETEEEKSLGEIRSVCLCAADRE